MEIFKLVGSIFVDSDDAQKSIHKTDQKAGALAKTLGGVGKVAGAFGKAFAAGTAVATGALVALGKKSVDAFAEYEQLVGGTELMFGKAYDYIADKAANAYATVQMSQNDYLQQVNGFATGLKTAMGGNEQAAAELADRIITAEADIVAATGNTQENVQNAFNGIMKSNYTMLDNLQIGITPTKQGFQDLIDKVNAWNAENGKATQYTIDNVADCQSALVDYIDMVGMSGYAQREASGTIQGALAMTKAAWSNLMTGLANGSSDMDQLMDNLINSGTALIGNLEPVISTFLEKIPVLISTAGEVIVQYLPNVFETALPPLIGGATKLVSSLVQVLPSLLSTVTSTIVASMPDIISGFMQIAEGLTQAIPQLLQQFLSALPALIPELANGAVQLIVMLTAMLPQIIQPIIDNLPSIIQSIMNAIVSNLPIIIQGLIQLMVSIVAALPDIIRALIESIPIIIEGIVKALIQCIPQLIVGIGQVCWELIRSIFEIFGAGDVADSIAGAFQQAWELIKVVWDKVKPYFEVIWTGIKAVFSVVKEVLGGAFGVAWTAIKAVWDTVTGFFKAIWDTIAGIFSVVGNVLTGNWSEAWEGIKGIAGTWGEFFKGVWEGIKSVFGAVGSWFSDIFSSAWEGIKSIWSSVKSFFSGIWENIKAAFNFSDMMNIGANLLKGLWNGINDKVEWLKSKVTGVIDKIKGWFTGKKGFDEHSPSKWSQAVGEFIDKGLALGIENEEDSVLASIGALVTDTRSEVEKVMDEMNESLLEGESKYARESERIELEHKNTEEQIENEKNSQKKEALKKKYEAQKEADSEYLAQLKQTAEEERKIYDAELKDFEAAKKKIVDVYQDLASNTLKSIDDIKKAEESLAEKLSSYGSLYQTVTIKLDDETLTYNRLTDLSKDTEQLLAYSDALQKVRDRGNVPEEFFSVLRDMSIEEGTTFANTLLSVSDEEFNAYIEAWKTKQQAATDISRALYKTESDKVAKDFLTSFNNITGSFTEIGQASSDNWASGFMENLESVLQTVRAKISDALGGISSGGVYIGEDIPQMAGGGVLPKGQVGFLEGNGAEAVVPLDQNSKWISAVAEDMNSAISGNGNGAVTSRLDDILGALEELLGAGIYLDTGALVGGLVKPLDRKFGQIAAQKARV